MSKRHFVPKLFTVLREGYTREQFTKDLLSGIIVGIVALPLCIAFGIASGVTPEKGLITGIIAGFLISFLGGSRVQIGGPTGAFIVIVYGIVQEYGVEGLIIATFMAGFILLIMGLAKLGAAIQFIPHPLIVGFTSGIALIIFSSQIKDFLGLEMGAVPSDFVDKWGAYAENLQSINLYAAVIAVATVVISFNFQRITPKIPGSLVAILLSTLAVQFFQLPVETIESRFGEIPSTLPMPGFPRIDFDTIQNLLQPAFTIAMLGAIESLLSAVVADGMIGSTHRSNMELVGQGVANIFSAMFGGIPATGAIARTATNVKNGGRTPVAGIIHAIVLLVIMLFVGKWAKLIPMATLAGILVVVSYNMSEWRSFAGILRGSRGEIAVLLTTFFLTVLIDLTVAIEIGMVLAAFLFMYRMTRISETKVITDQIMTTGGIEDVQATKKLNLPPGVEVYEVNGPLFFGAAHNFKQALKNINRKPEILIIRMRHVPIIDSTGVHNLKEIVRDFRAQKTEVVLSGVQPEVHDAMEKLGFLEYIGDKNVCPNIEMAVERVQEIKSSLA